MPGPDFVERPRVNGQDLALLSEVGGGSAFDPATAMRLFDDFAAGLLTTGNIGDNGWSFAGGTVTNLSPVAGRPGVIQRATGGTANTICSLYPRNSASTAVFLASDLFDVAFSLRFNQSPGAYIGRIGVAVDAAANPAAAGVYFESLATDAGWFGVARNASAQTRTAQLVAGSTSWVRFRLRRVDASTVGFSINGGAETTLNTNVPVGQVLPFVQIVNTTTTAQSFDLDYVDCKVTGLTR